MMTLVLRGILMGGPTRASVELWMPDIPCHNLRVNRISYCCKHRWICVVEMFALVSCAAAIVFVEFCCSFDFLTLGS